MMITFLKEMTLPKITNNNSVRNFPESEQTQER